MKIFKLSILLIMVFILVGCGTRVPDSLQRDEKEYLIYLYHPDCPACSSIKADVDSYIANIDRDDLVMLYTVDIRFILQRDLERIGASQVPVMFYVRNGRIQKQALGTTNIQNLLDDFRK